MAISLNRNPGDRLLEIGGGENPIVVPACMGGNDVAVDIRNCWNQEGQQTVDFCVDLEKPLPIKDNDFDGVISRFCLEHVSYRNIKQALSEIYRVLKLGGKILLVLPNTEAQIQWIKANPNGWDGKDAFESCSELIFGSQDYSSNNHKSFFTPQIIMDLLQSVGFGSIVVHPYGDRDTDMAVEAVRPSKIGSIFVEDLEAKELPVKMGGKVEVHPLSPLIQPGNTNPWSNFEDKPQDNVLDDGVEDISTETKPINVRVEQSSKIGVDEANIPREKLFDRIYFQGGAKVGGYAREGYWDFPCHWVTAQKILDRKPSSVLEIGSARGYILKRLENTGIPSQGLEISRHCWLTRVHDPIDLWDICKPNWPVNTDEQGNCFGPLDVGYSIAVLEHVPEELLPIVLGELKRTTLRGLHGIDFAHKDDGFDKTHCLIRSKEWWRRVFDEHGLQSHEIVDKEEMEAGPPSEDVLKGDGKVKLNLGSWLNMLHMGWVNIDLHDIGQFAQHHGYNFNRHDLRQGVPANTESVHLIYMGNLLQYLTPDEAIKLLRDCRRVLLPDGALRISVINARAVIGHYVSSINPELNAQSLEAFDELDELIGKQTTPMGKLWALLHANRLSMWDKDNLLNVVSDAGFQVNKVNFLEAAFTENSKQIVREAMENSPEINLFVDAIPKLT